MSLTKIKTLVLDDEAHFRDLFSEILQEEGHEVYSVESLSEAREQLASRRFHLAVIDIVLGEREEGLTLLEEISKLNQEPHINGFCGPLIFTNYSTRDRVLQALRQEALAFREKSADPEDFIVSKMGAEERGFVEQELRDAARKVLRKVLLERGRRYEEHKHTLCFHLAPGQKTRADLLGCTSFCIDSTEDLNIDVEDFANRTDDLQFHFGAADKAQRRKWRSRAKKIGKSLHQQLFAGDAELTGCLSTARERSNQGPLHFVFRGSQDMIRLPIELLPSEAGGYLIMEGPLTRKISGIKTVRNRGIDRLFFEEVSPVKVLLIGSNTNPPIPEVDDEIDLLEDKIQHLFRSRGFDCRIQALPTEKAYYDNVYDYLEKCQYHIIHYAGHGYHDEKDTDESGLFFWEGPNKTGQVQPMPIRVLRNLLTNSQTCFFYLSCCVGAKTIGEAKVKLNGDDFQGIMEGLVRVGIPGALGCRWNVWDTEAKQLALAFYESLLTDLSLDVATFKARRALQEASYYNETWASPVLVAQNV
jgi:CheY-like chemotaxis protein